MSATELFQTDLLGLIFANSTDATNVGDATGLVPSTTAGSFYIALSTATLTEAHTTLSQTEATYTGYGTRPGVTRDLASGGWTVSAGQVVNNGIIAFPACTGGTNTITDYSIGNVATTAGVMQFFGALTSSLAVSDGVTPEFADGALVITLT